jgi:hypothetical protein
VPDVTPVAGAAAVNVGFRIMASPVSADPADFFTTKVIVYRPATGTVK